VGTNRKRRELPKEIPGLEYYPLRRSWTRKIVPHLQEKKLNAILVRDFNRYTLGMWNIFFRPGMLPEQIDTCDWRLDKRRPYPRYWQYVRHGACHWIVNFALRLAMLAEPVVMGTPLCGMGDGRCLILIFRLLDFLLLKPGRSCAQAVVSKC